MCALSKHMLPVHCRLCIATDVFQLKYSVRCIASDTCCRCIAADGGYIKHTFLIKINCTMLKNMLFISKCASLPQNATHLCTNCKVFKLVIVQKIYISGLLIKSFSLVRYHCLLNLGRSTIVLLTFSLYSLYFSIFEIKEPTTKFFARWHYKQFYRVAHRYFTYLDTKFMTIVVAILKI